MTSAADEREKSRLRSAMRARLAAVTAGQARAAGVAIADRIEQVSNWTDSVRVAVFMSRHNEVDTAPLIQRTIERGKSIMIPRVTGSVGLEFCVMGDLGRLGPGPFGIPEPPPQLPAVCPDDRDLLILPGLAFDRDGGRLGRGGGYYDRVLADLRTRDLHPHIVGIGFSFQLIEHVPMMALDVSVDGVVTEDSTVESGGLRSWPRDGR